MTDRNDLLAKTDEELRAIAHDLGLELHHKLGRAKVIDAIMEAVAPTTEAAPEVELEIPVEPETLENNTPVVETAPKASVPVTLTDKQLEIMKITETHRVRGMTVKFPDAHSWHFRNGLKEDTGNVNIPIQNIRRCADIVCKPVKAPTAQKS